MELKNWDELNKKISLAQSLAMKKTMAKHSDDEWEHEGFAFLNSEGIMVKIWVVGNCTIEEIWIKWSEV